MRSLFRRFPYRKPLLILPLAILIVALVLSATGCVTLTHSAYYYTMVWRAYDADGNFQGYGGSGGIRIQTMQQTSLTYVNGEYSVFPYATGSVPYAGRIQGFFMTINVNHAQGNVQIQSDLTAGLFKEPHSVNGIFYWVLVGWQMEDGDDWVYKYVDGTYNGKILFVPTTYTVNPPSSTSDAIGPVFSSQEEFEKWAGENGVDADEAMSAPTIIDVPDGTSDSQLAAFLANAN